MLQALGSPYCQSTWTSCVCDVCVCMYVRPVEAK